MHELALTYIFQLKFSNIEYYPSTIHRLNRYECAIFALIDAVTFMQNGGFFERIKFHPSTPVKGATHFL